MPRSFTSLWLFETLARLTCNRSAISLKLEEDHHAAGTAPSWVRNARQTFGLFRDGELFDEQREPVGSHGPFRSDYYVYSIVNIRNNKRSFMRAAIFQRSRMFSALRLLM